MVEAVKHGIIDVGSNGIRMQVLSVGPNTVERLHKHRIAVRLGTEVFSTGRISAPLQDAVVDAFRTLQGICAEMGTEQISAVATAATRDAANHPELVTRIQQELGLTLDVIDGVEEADLIATAMTSRLGPHDGTTACLDLGGGSVEVVIIDGTTTKGRSFPIGALRLLQEALADAPAHGPEVVPRLHAHISAFATEIRALNDGQPVARLAAAGGSLERLETLMTATGETTTENEIPQLPFDRLEEWESRMAQLTVGERMAKYDLPADRADTILPAAAVTLCVGRILGARAALVPRVGLVDGIAERLRRAMR